MKIQRVVPLLLAAASSAVCAGAHPRGLTVAPGPLVAVTVEIDGEPAPLFPAPDGSGRLYLEAREGRSYALTLRNRCPRRVGVVLAVDGLNAISGTRDEGRRGRMYVLDAWQSATIRGWRSSLQEVREFAFVDERSSYAARSGKANGKMGWIELAVYRERVPVSAQAPAPAPDWNAPLDRRERDEAARAPREKAERGARSDAAPAGSAEGAARSYPGTGWGRSSDDPVVLVDFQPEEQASQTLTLRYEYRPALVALGVLPRRGAPDRLAERESAQPGFAEPPLW